MKILIKNAHAILPDGYDKNCAVAIDNGTIVSVGAYGARHVAFVWHFWTSWS